MTNILLKKSSTELENQLHVLNKRTNYLKFVMGFRHLDFYSICSQFSTLSISGYAIPGVILLPGVFV